MLSVVPFKGAALDPIFFYHLPSRNTKDAALDPDFFFNHRTSTTAGSCLAQLLPSGQKLPVLYLLMQCYHENNNLSKVPHTVKFSSFAGALHMRGIEGGKAHLSEVRLCKVVLQ